MTLTYVDSGILIAASRGGDIGQRAVALLAEPQRRFASSLFVQLEVEPKAQYYRRWAELLLYRAFFEAVEVWAPPDQALIQSAYQAALTTGLAALDAIHATAAVRVGAEELVTTEATTKPIHRVRGLKITTLYSSTTS